MECESGRRVKRSPVELHNASSIVHDFDSQLALRVVGLKDHPSSILDDEFPFDYTSASQTYLNRTKMDNGAITCNEKLVISGFGGGCIALLICGLGLALFTYIRQGKITREKSSSPTYQYPPPPGRMRTGVNPAPYHKPLPPPPPSQQQQPPPPPKEKEKSMSSELSQVAELLQHFKNNEANNKNSNIGNKTSSKSESKPRESSEYACIDETNSSSSSSEDLTNPNKKDGVYILYCYNKDKKNKQKQIMLPLSAPTSMRLRRKHLKQAENLDDDDEDFIDDDDSETVVSQTEDATEESDDSYAVAEHGNNKSSNLANNINKNQGCRRTVRDVKKKSKQNNNLAYASTRSRIRRRVSSVYREGYIHGVRGGSSFPLRYKKSPSTGNIPAITGHNNSGHQPSAKRINFSVRESRSTRNKRHHQKNHIQDQYSSEGMLSEGTVMTSSDLDSAYSGSNCSKLTEDYLYELKRSGGDGNIAGRYPDARNLRKLQNLMDVQRQLRGGSGAQGQKQKFLDKQEVRRTSSANTNVQVGLGSPPLNLGETKATHFVTRDDSSTKILIVPETHV
ncbi:unnamed protein product [Orchesella dallaii]|uniref:Uncharacterized protein n=1 Tax=Orchesella dallaii TaxID=48710 RepID=A0ABP1RD36_9HEXA